MELTEQLEAIETLIQSWREGGSRLLEAPALIEAIESILESDE